MLLSPNIAHLDSGPQMPKMVGIFNACTFARVTVHACHVSIFWLICIVSVMILLLSVLTFCNPWIQFLESKFKRFLFEICQRRSNPPIVRRSPPRHSPPQTFTTSDVHHPRHSPPQTFTTPCVKSDIHHPRHSPPQMFITSDIHHPRRSLPKTFITPCVKSNFHHPFAKMWHSPPLLPWCKVVWTAGTFWMLGRLVNFSFGGDDCRGWWMLVGG